MMGASISTSHASPKGERRKKRKGEEAFLTGRKLRSLRSPDRNRKRSQQPR
jgi:hypothetical protein